MSACLQKGFGEFSAVLSGYFMDTTDAAVLHDPYAALRFRDFRLLAVSRFVSSLGEMMLSVAVGWELYERTGSAFALGLVGLVQVLPVILLALIAGPVADRFNRKRIVLTSQLLLGVVSLGLALLSYTQGSLVLVYGCLLLFGVLRAFNDPASSTLLPQSVPPEVFHSAATWSSSAWQLASVLGPALGGLAIGAFHAATPVYVANAVACLIFLGLVSLMRGRPLAQSSEAMTRESLTAGLTFIWRTPIILSAITLDLFGVLFGGATALLPVYAKDILQVGPEGLGWLRTAPSVGAILMVLVTAHLPPFQKAGKALLYAVIGFGVVTIIFGVSRSFALSLMMLMLLGALDNVSVIIRSTLLLTRTPDDMRGRVSAVNGVFISMSNEMGAFESGIAAAAFGPILAVVTGGIGTILVVLVVMYVWPELRQLGKLSDAA
jgi:MFS family permease